MVAWHAESYLAGAHQGAKVLGHVWVGFRDKEVIELATQPPGNETTSRLRVSRTAVRWDDAGGGSKRGEVEIARVEWFLAPTNAQRRLVMCLGDAGSSYQILLISGSS